MSAHPERTADASQRKSSLMALAEEAATGEPEATGKLLRALAPDMIRAAQALMGTTHADVDDVIQQSFIALVQALPAFRGECSPSHYATRIVARIAVAARRRSKVRGERYDEAVDVDQVLSHGESAPEQLESARRRELVRGLLETLPEEQAETLALRIGLGFSLGEVAAATGVPLNTVRSRVRLAKEALRRRIDANPELSAALEVES